MKISYATAVNLAKAMEAYHFHKTSLHASHENMAKATLGFTLKELGFTVETVDYSGQCVTVENDFDCDYIKSLLAHN